MSIHIDENVDLSHWHTFGVKAAARYFVHLRRDNDLEELFDSVLFRDHRRLLLGGGSNVLFLHDFDGLVIHMAIDGIKVDDVDDRQVLVTAGAGVIWNDLVRFCVQHGYGGIENLTLIPGTVGAAPIQNIGAYGVELESVFDHLDAWNLTTAGIQRFRKKECHFGYRDSYFKNGGKHRYLVTSVTLRLTKKPQLNLSYSALSRAASERGIDPGKATISDISRLVEDIRTSKLPDPAKIGNSGSFFKNPVIPEKQYHDLALNYEGIPGFKAGKGMKVPAGWLIEQCGFKGGRYGNVGVYDRQALVLINHGGATGREVFELSERIIEEVRNKFDIQLEHEVNIIV
ncbi:MAG TPA: UDP-N-acetylmuramate dehydrogenase [Balneolales bacterium]|nr:UDP-N-acetylmuramate dehydrogenase [Balneolales bacterium]